MWIYGNEKSGVTPACILVLRLFGKSAIDQLSQAIQSSFLVLTVCNQRNGHALGDTQRQYAQQALGVDSTLFFFDPDRALVAICFLNKEGRRSGVQTDTIGNLYFA